MLTPRSRWQRLAREPLVHFAVLGVIVFGVDAARHESPASSLPAQRSVIITPPSPTTEGALPRTPIVIDTAERARIRAQADRRVGRVATAADVAAETDHWIDEEVLYREGMRRGLNRNDPMIRKRVASRMSYVLEQSIIVPEPTDRELRRWFATHRARWSIPTRVAFTHVFVAGTDAPARKRLARAATALAAGAQPARLGDSFAGGRRFRGRRLDQLARAFGDSFSRDLHTQPRGRWIQRRSRFGLHLVRVDRIEPARPAEFATARLDVRKAWRDQHRQTLLDAARARLRSGWQIDAR